MRKLALLAAAGLLALSVPGVQAGGGLDANVTLRGSEVHVALGNGYSNATLTVSGPNGFHAQAYSRTGTASIDLIRAGGTADGEYTYEITAATTEDAVNNNPMDNGRGGVDKSAGKVGASTSGTFAASGGIIKDTASMAEIKE